VRSGSPRLPPEGCRGSGTTRSPTYVTGTPMGASREKARADSRGHLHASPPSRMEKAELREQSDRLRGFNNQPVHPGPRPRTSLDDTASPAQRSTVRSSAPGAAWRLLFGCFMMHRISRTLLISCVLVLSACRAGCHANVTSPTTESRGERVGPQAGSGHPGSDGTALR